MSNEVPDITTMTILMVGNLREGWYAYGPFEDDNAAQDYAREQGIRIYEEAIILEMEVPEWPEDEDDEDEDEDEENE